MSWFSQFLKSSIGKKLIMSLTGLFLVLFLVVHLSGNLQLLSDDGGESFNMYTKFMTGNPLIKTISYVTYLLILLHTIQGIMIWRQNRGARASRYAVSSNRYTTFASRNMGALGTIILIFLLLHMYQFWLQMKIDATELIVYGDHEPVKDLYALVAVAFKQPLYVVIYVLSMIVIAFHLRHGFQSAFQSLGLNHVKYNGVIRFLGNAIAILIPLGFAIIPVFFYLFR